MVGKDIGKADGSPAWDLNPAKIRDNFLADVEGSKDPKISETMATPSNACPVVDTDPCRVRRTFVDFIPPISRLKTKILK